MNLESIQRELQQAGIDGWLFFDHHERDPLAYRVLGLKTPHLSLPATGHAQFMREYDNLKGTYEVIIEGLDGKTNSFSVRIAPQQVRLVSAPSQSFITVCTDRGAWPDK